MATSPKSVEMRMPPENSQLTELVDGDGDFNESGFEDFIRGGDASILVFAIVGPQASGKSTLMNHLFGTDFTVMNAKNGRSKTTKGIWIAKAPHMEPLTVVLDLEGTDGRERGENDTIFEKQSALFALAVAHTVIINMWSTDVGREHGANRPLLKTIFEAMLSLSLFSPQKTTLNFVVRDHDKAGTPSEFLERDLKEDVEKIWEAVPKPSGQEDTPLTDIFNVKVTVLSHYGLMRHVFNKEVAHLKLQLISHTEHDNIDLPTSKISLSSAKKTWDMIKEYKDLTVPPIRVMVATMRCEEIAMDKLRLFQSNQAWLDLQQNAKTQLVKDFGAQTSSILTTYLSEYDKESMYLARNVTKGRTCDENSTKGTYDPHVYDVRSSKRQYLTLEALKVVHPAYMNTLGHVRSEALRSFTTQLNASGEKFSASSFWTCHDSCVLQFDRQCSDHATIEQAKWEDDASTVRQQLLREIKEHALYQLKEELSINLNTHVLRILEDRSVKDIWAYVRRVLKSESETGKSAAVDIFGAEHEQIGRIIADLEQHARNRVETTFRDESRNVEDLIRKRFVAAFIPMDAKTASSKEEAYRQCLDILCTMAVIRIDDTYDVVQRELHSELMGANSGNGLSTYSLSSVTWEKVPHQMTLITPVGCREIWNKFKIDMELLLANAEEYQKKQRGKSSLPKWAILGLLVLGVSAFAALLLCYPQAATALALAATLARGIITEYEDGKYRHSGTKEDIKKEDILKKHPQFMASLRQDLITAYECITIVNKIIKVVPIVAKT